MKDKETIMIEKQKAQEIIKSTDECSLISALIDFVEKYNINPKNIFDLGSRNLKEAIVFSKIFPEAQVYSFECDPEKSKICSEEAKNHSNIHFSNEAINNIDGYCKFYPIDMSKHAENHGWSSLFLFNNEVYTKKQEEYLFQYELDIPCVRLDSFIDKKSISAPDILWCDLQGAELLAFQGLGRYLKDVKIICTELCINTLYKNCCLYKDTWELLKENFIQIYGNHYENGVFENFIFINKEIYENK